MLVAWEYYTVQEQSRQLHLLYAQYHGYVDGFKRFFQNKKNNPSLNVELKQEPDDERHLDSFLVLSQSSSLQNYSKLLLEEISMEKDEAQNEKKAILYTNQQNKKPPITVKQSQKKPLTNISFMLPIEDGKFWVSSFYGPRKKLNGKWGFHYGIDMAAHRGTLVTAVAKGVIEQAIFVSGYGNTVVIKHDEVYKTRYAHLDEILVTDGQQVMQGELIGKVGDTGYTRKRGHDASHLHLELYENGTQINPLSLLSL